jgi:hypothetical protein
MSVGVMKDKELKLILMILIARIKKESRRIKKISLSHTNCFFEKK